MSLIQSRFFFTLLTLALLSALPTPSAFAQSDAAAAAAPPPTPVRVAAVRSESLAPRKKVFGDLRPARYSTLAAEEAGIVCALLVREGEVVERDAVIARVDGARLAVELANNTRNLAAAKATVAEKSANFSVMQRHLALLTTAAKEGGANPREILDAQSTLETSKSQITQATAMLELIEGNAEFLAIRGADLEIRAPFRGVVTKKHTEIGAWLGAGDPVVDLAETTVLEASLEVPQELFEAAVAEARRMASDPSAASPIEIRDALDHSVQARALRLIPAIDPRSRTFRAILDVANPDGALAAGLTLTAYVPAGAAQLRLLVPKDALLRGDAGPFVYAVRNGLAMPVNVQIAFPFGNFVALEVGSLSATDSVVVEGNERLMPMSPVAAMTAITAEAAK